jgi:transcriptional regulator with XRE-family HTH domain
MDAKALVGQRIREGRETLGLSQEALADRVGTSVQQVSRAERGVQDIRVSTLLRLAQGIGVSGSDLLRDL